jgi:uncharacterized repeat protein (TIGR01451 family)
MAHVARFSAPFRERHGHRSPLKRRRRDRHSIRALIERLESLVMPTAFVVTSTADSGPGTLRQAIIDSNASFGTNNITFQINGTGLQTIDVASTLTITAPVILDGTTQTGYSGTPLIELNGSGLGSQSSELKISAGNTTVTGLLIDGSSTVGIELTGIGGDTISGNTIGGPPLATPPRSKFETGLMIEDVPRNNILGNLVSGNLQCGVDISGVNAFANIVQGDILGTDSAVDIVLHSQAVGIAMDSGATNNTIGGTAANAANCISGNTIGIEIAGTETSGNVVEGNFIGTDASGTTAVPNSSLGVTIYAGATGNTIGGTTAADRNVISGNQGGLTIFGAGTSANIVEGNFIGTDVTGTRAVPNLYEGAAIYDGATGNTIGGISTGEGNIISGNTINGVSLSGAGTSANVVVGNFVGTDKTGTVALANSIGIDFFDGSSRNTIGGIAGAGNIISGNSTGIIIRDSGSSGNIIEGNLIGLAVNGMAVVSNGIGVSMQNGASGNTIGGTVSSEGNVISGNQAAGVTILGPGTSDNLVQGNFIGTDPSGTAAMPNHTEGIHIFSSASSNTVGGTARGAGNVVSGNSDSGLVLSDTGTTDNLIQGNKIGTDNSGEKAVPNGSAGVAIYAGGTGNTLGGVTQGAGNLVSGNSRGGFEISDPGTTGNLLQGNLIGTDATGLLPLGNAFGLDVEGGATNNTIGGAEAGAGNIISGNQTDGIEIASSGTTNNVFEGNTIGSSDPARRSLGNAVDGILLFVGATGNTIGGATAGSGNVISENGRYGVGITDVGTSGNILEGNTIGRGLGNGAAGVAIINGSIGNWVGEPNHGNDISSNQGPGIELAQAATSGNHLVGNSIQVDGRGDSPAPGISIQDAGVTFIDGNAIVGCGSDGITLSDSSANEIDANEITDNASAGVNVTGTSARNVIGSGGGNILLRNQKNGITLSGSGVTGTTIASNYIGIDPATYQTGVPTATSLGNAGDGIDVDGQANLVGGLAPGTGNIIELNGGTGIRVAGSGPGLAILSNLISSNVDPTGIVEPNPPSVLPPVLSLALTASGSTAVQGVVQSMGGLSGAYLVQFFSKDSVTGRGRLEGQQVVSVGQSGSAAFDATIGALNPGQVVFATATDPKGDTSVFSLSPPVQAGSADLSVSLSVATGALLIGQPLVYHATILNAGATTATGVSLVDILPANVVLDSVNVSSPLGAGSYSVANGRVVAAIGDLNPSGVANVTIMVTTELTGVAQNVAAVISDETDPNPSNNASFAAVNVLPPLVTATSARVGTQIVKHRRQLVINVGFSGPIDATRAIPSADYALSYSVRAGKRGTKNVAIPIANVQVASSGAEVVLIPKSTLPTKKLVQLRVSTSALRDTAGRPIVGNQPNGDFVTTLSSSVSTSQVHASRAIFGARVPKVSRPWADGGGLVFARKS